MTELRGAAALRRLPAWVELPISLGVALVIWRWAFLPLHGEMSLNLVSIVEPYMRAPNLLMFMQLLVTLLARVLLAPFVVYWVYVATRRLLRHFTRRPAATPTKPRDPAQRKPLRRRILRAYGLACATFLALEAVAYGGFVVRAFEEPAGVIAFHRSCGQCHSQVRAFNHNFPAEMWESTVERMQAHAELATGEITLENREAITRFLIRTRSYSDERLLRSKCFTCHMPQHLFSRKRTPEQWTRIVDRMQRQNQFHLSLRNAEQITRALSADPERSFVAPEEGPEAATLERQRIFEEKCGMCHTLDILFVPGMDGEQVTEQDWKTILARMGKKVPHWLDEDSSLELWPLLREALAAPETFYSDYPHSRRRER